MSVDLAGKSCTKYRIIRLIQRGVEEEGAWTSEKGVEIDGVGYQPALTTCGNGYHTSANDSDISGNNVIHGFNKRGKLLEKVLNSSSKPRQERRRRRSRRRGMCGVSNRSI